MIIHPLDNVEVRDDGHKYAIRPIAPGENVIKYGMPIGHAKVRIEPGEHVHTHNLASNLAGLLEYAYKPDFKPLAVRTTRTFKGYLRPDGQAGVRNDLWVIPTVGCVNDLARNLLAAFAHHPNAGGVLIVGLGCENNTLDSFRERLGDISKLNIRFLRAQDDGDEYARGLELLAELDAARVKDRTDIPVSALRVGLKCGGSDGLSGLTANPLVGRFSDWLAAQGGTTVLTEVPEMFGAETLLMNRCVSREVFDKCVAMINGFKSYYERHGQPIDENPSPGNKAGGISTLEDKSLGCVQKGGSSPVVDVLEYGERLKTPGLNLLAGPGNDLVASSVLAAAGCQLVLFTTGRGTPFGTVVPTVKVATNTRLAQSKPHWIDWDAQGRPDTNAFVEFVLKVASGKIATNNEKNDAREIAIFKDGVTL